MKKIFFLVLLAVICLRANEIELNLRDFANLSAKNSGVDIIISDEIDTNNFLFYTSKSKRDITINDFIRAVDSKGLRVINHDNTYMIETPKSQEIKELIDFENEKNRIVRYVKLDNFSVEDIERVLGISDINSSHIVSSNSVVFKANDDEFKEIYPLIKKTDLKRKQVTFKITILETNLDNIKNIGSDLNSLGSLVSRGDFNLFVNLLTMPFKAETNVIKSKQSNFYSVLNFLVENSYVSIKQSPFLTAKSGKEVFFSSVENIPYLISEQTVTNNQSTYTNSYEYKDIGLKIKIKPFVVKNSIDFDLDLVIENIVDNSNNLPITSKKELKSNYTINKNEILVLSGINKDIVYQKTNGIPFLKDIPILKYLFSIKQDETIHSVFSMIIEVI